MGPITKTAFGTVHFDGNPFTYSRAGEKGLNHDLIFGTFIGRFLSDVTASMAAKGLKSQSQTKYDHKENTQSHIF